MQQRRYGGAREGVSSPRRTEGQTGCLHVRLLVGWSVNRRRRRRHEQMEAGAYVSSCINSK